MEDDSQDQNNYLLPPTGSLVNAGTTPPWHTSQLQPTESSMRSTLTAPSYDFSPSLPQMYGFHVDTPGAGHHQTSDAMSIHNLVNPSDTYTYQSPTYPSFTPINPAIAASLQYDMSTPRKFPTNSINFTMHSGRYLKNFDVDMNHIDSYETVADDGRRDLYVDPSSGVDKEDGRVYHIGHCDKGTYSGTLSYDSADAIPPEAVMLANQIEEKRLKPARMVASAEILLQLHALVDQGEQLSVGRTSFVEEGDQIPCERPGCRFSEGLNSDAYYAGVGYQYTFCLNCFEMLWSGKCTDGLPPQSVLRRDSAIQMAPGQFDGADDLPLGNNSDLYKSRWAVPDDELQDLAAVQTPEEYHSPEVEEDFPSSPSSIESNGQWRYPPTTMQHIAHLFEAEASMSEMDKAVLTLWQAASKHQLMWEQHLQRAEATRAYYAGESSEDIGLHTEKLIFGADVEEEELEKLEMMALLRKKDCYGQDLSEVLSLAAQNKAWKPKRDLK